MTQFLTVKEAASLTGKSGSSIRRIIHPIVQNDDHPDRGQIQPSVEDARARRLRGENFPWRISEELLRREIPLAAQPEKGSATSGRIHPGDSHGELLAMLRRELDIKNQQIQTQAETIAKQTDLISGLSERIREGNVLMASLQKHLALPASESLTPENATNKMDVKRGDASPQHPKKKTPKQGKPKRGFFSRFFH